VQSHLNSAIGAMGHRTQQYESESQGITPKEENSCFLAVEAGDPTRPPNVDGSVERP
jgi:hypothetical protein